VVGPGAARGVDGEGHRPAAGGAVRELPAAGDVAHVRGLVRAARAREAEREEAGAGAGLLVPHPVALIDDLALPDAEPRAPGIPPEGVAHPVGAARPLLGVRPGRDHHLPRPGTLVGLDRVAEVLRVALLRGPDGLVDPGDPHLGPGSWHGAGSEEQE